MRRNKSREQLPLSDDPINGSFRKEIELSVQNSIEWAKEMKNKYRWSVMEGAFKGFMLYLVPITLMRRKLTNHTLRRATAVAAFASIARTLHIWLQDVKAEKIERERRKKLQVKSTLN
jgi:hypothetical protein